jgi:hypothetical protein
MKPRPWRLRTQTSTYRQRIEENTCPSDDDDDYSNNKENTDQKMNEKPLHKETNDDPRREKDNKATTIYHRLQP